MSYAGKKIKDLDVVDAVDKLVGIDEDGNTVLTDAESLSPGGGGGVFVVHATKGSGTNVTVDEPFEDIVEAYEAGKDIICKMSTSQTMLTITATLQLYEVLLIDDEYQFTFYSTLITDNPNDVGQSWVIDAGFLALSNNVAVYLAIDEYVAVKNGHPDELLTEDNSSLVGAINEVLDTVFEVNDKVDAKTERFIITLTQNSGGTLSVDKTFQQIFEAYTDGKELIMKWAVLGGAIWLYGSLAMVADTAIGFSFPVVLGTSEYTPGTILIGIKSNGTLTQETILAASSEDVGDIADLTTTAKSDLVAAINELNARLSALEG